MERCVDRFLCMRALFGRVFSTRGRVLRTIRIRPRAKTAVREAVGKHIMVHLLCRQCRPQPVSAKVALVARRHHHRRRILPLYTACSMACKCSERNVHIPPSAAGKKAKFGTQRILYGGTNHLPDCLRVTDFNHASCNYTGRARTDYKF